ncbi:polyprotein [Glycine soja]
MERFLWNQMKAKILENIIAILFPYLFDEEVRFEDINQNMDDWNIPEIPQDQLYVPETIKDKHNFDYIIKTVENNIPLGQDIGEEFHLLSKNSIYEHSRKYKYLHIGCVQVAIKPLIDMGIDAAVLMCLRDIRHNQFEDSLIGTVETSLGQGPIYFNCYPNKTVSLMDRNILDSLFLNIHFHGLDMKEGSIPAALIYRIQYKVMNTCASRVLLKPQKGETTLFITDMTKANVSLPRKIKWDEVTLPERWVMDKATPSIPRPAPTIEHIKQDNSGKVEITFNRRNSFSSRIEASRSEYESARRSFSVRTRSIPVGLTRSESHNQFPTVNLQGLDTTSSIPRTTYNQEQEDDQKKPLGKISILRRMNLKGDGFSNITRVQTENNFKSFSANNIYEWNIDAQTEYNIMNTLQHMIMVATAYQTVDYPWKQDIIGDPTTNVITNWQVKDGELIQSELPPATQYQLPNIKDSNNKPVMAIPFKTKDVNEEITSKDIKSLMEQANYTNKYLQALGETIKIKVVPKQKSIEETSPRIPIEKPLFKPFKVSEKAKRKIRELRKTKSLIEGIGDNHSELLNKIGSLLKVIPDTPQASENTSKMVTRSTSKLINVINEDSDQNSDDTTEIGLVSEKNINPINSKHWKTPSKLYYQRPTAPDLLLEERGENNFKSFSANNIYEWNIDAQTEYNIMNTLQHMTMVATAYQTSHECSEETIIDILVAGFSGQLKGWWDNYLTNEEKSKIYSAVKTDLNGKVITNDDDKEIPDAVNTLIFTIAQHFIGDPSLWKDRSAELLSNLKCRTLADFRWYRDTFLTRVYTREDSQQPFWKEKFLAGLPRSLGDKVRDKIRSQSANGDIPYESLSYGQLISYVQKVALKICQDDKIQRQLAKEKAQTKRDLGSFCEQFGLPACPKQKKKQSSKKEIHENKPVNTKRFPRRRYSHKPSTSRGMENPKQKTKSKITCYNCGKQGHISKYCRLKKKLRNLNLEPEIEEQINNLLIETSEEETETSSSVLSDENLNLIQQDDQLSSTDDDDGQINTLTREQDLLFEAINSIPDPQEKKVFLEKLKKTLEVKPRQKDFITNNKFDVSKGARLALPEPTMKKSSTSSGSPTQAGSSTQKTNLEGSSTQIASIKPEPSTQESPKPATAKQTSADYAWPIETLQALQDMGLTKFPKIIKKSWADIASESDDESESNLQTMIQNASMTKTATNTKGKLPLAKAQTPPTKQTNNYIYKNKLLTVLQMEPEFWDKNPFKATAKAFPPGFHYKPTTILKTRTFYELILVDSNSVSIKHFKDPKDQTLNTHSTIQILKVLQPRHFGSDLNKGKRFSVPFDPVGYTYWDYVDAWTKVFWHQNTRFKHSWLIYFKTNTIYNFPNWFLQWWDFFGPIPEIFPETVQQGFSQFKKQYNSQESRIPADLKYFSSFALSWIFSWQYRYSKTEKTNQYPSLQRHAFVKWWTQFDSSKADPEQVKLWFQSHPEFLKAADPETSVFLNQKSHLAAFLAGSTSKEVLAKNLKEVLQMLQQEEEASSSKKEETSSTGEDEEDPFYQNEDDCFGICLD